jgi:hypothetical protein
MSTLHMCDEHPEKRPHPTFSERWADGTVREGNQTARKHGVRAFEQRGPAALPDVLRQTVEEFREAVIADRGGLTELSTLEAAYIRRLAEVEATARLLAHDLASRGLTTPRGRVRGTFSRWLECLDRWDRLAQRIGTETRRPVLTLAERLAGKSTGQDGADSTRDASTRDASAEQGDQNARRTSYD